MGKFCTSCGRPLEEGAKFCAGCGTAVIPVPAQAKETPDVISPPKGSLVSKAAVKVKAKAQKEVKTYREKALAGAIPAYGTAGEYTLPVELTPFPAGVGAEGLVSLLKSGLRGLLGGFKRTLGDKKRLAIVIALTVIWLLVNVLAISGIFPFPIRLLSWLTAARGSFIGGAIGKSLIAALLAQIITNKEMLQNMKDGMNQLTALVKGGKKNYSSLLMGMGIALIACNMMVSSNLQNTMVSITAFVFSLRSLTRNGFLRQLITSFLPKAKDTFITSIMAGWTFGFAVFTAISFLPGGKKGYLLGFMLLVIGGILEIMSKNKREVATK